ncbi:SDR family NAD(P)-dependent oxidoreductase [Tropicimonas aquimaris]|uniref:SDR family NAD(P)-dependent oxidoreductase n=1 Tax=Tropicimonas aquimaris TaxID=914152 RepID=A0ABW3IS14_9RHOB
MSKAALVTGGNRGIGRAIAAGLVAQGVDVTLTARDPEAGAAAAAELGCALTQAYLARPDTLAQFEAADFDILVNNAGVLPKGGMLANPDGFFECMAVMVDGPFRLIHALAPGMMARGYGRIVNLSSGWVAFAEGLEGPGAYGTAKAALNALTLALSRELPDTVKINAACPGWDRTRMGGAGAPTSIADGADTPLWFATLPQDGPTGGFFRRRKPIPW